MCTQIVYTTQSFDFEGKSVAVLGDISKLVPLSKDRIQSVYIDSKGFHLLVTNPISIRSKKFTKKDEVRMGFCLNGDYIEKTFQLEPTYLGPADQGKFEETTEFLFEPDTGKISCPTCAVLECTECPAECPVECADQICGFPSAGEGCKQSWKKLKFFNVMFQKFLKNHFLKISYFLRILLNNC